MRREIPILITMFAGIFMIVKFFLEVITGVQVWGDELLKIVQVVIVSAVVLGLGNILRINLRAIAQRRRDWGYKVALLASLFLAMGAGIYAFATTGGTTSTVRGAMLFQDLYDNLLYPLSATMFSLLAFYIASASFRAFRARNLSAGLLMAAALLIMLGRVPLGSMISHGLGLGELVPHMTDWIMQVPNAAGQRGIFIGVALGVVAVGLRIIFGVERPYLKGD